ncbi:hypothetical protein Bbelb_027900 [Branchiostoma belcheri]|nr:hypothetical protein Bbelb_027900 [Branchiostoma belcheri]
MGSTFQYRALDTVDQQPTAYALRCTHQLTGNRGHIRSGTDVTSNNCEWDITTDPDRIILINFDRGYFERGSDGCTTEVLTFYDGGSENSRVVDTTCSPVPPLRGQYGTSATRGSYTQSESAVVEHEPVFNENTFVPQTEEDFDQRTVADFVRITVDILILDDQFVSPYGYSTGGDILEFYLAIQEGVLDFDLTPGMHYTCWPTHSGTEAYGQLIVNSADRNFPLDDWPWIAFYFYEPWDENVGILKYTYRNVKVGEENSALNEVKCAIKGQTFPIEVTVKACPIGRFGRFCAERCQCYNGAACHSLNGACRCALGWTGRNCTTVHPEVRISPSTSELNDLRFGQEVQLTCTAYNFRVNNFNWVLDGAPVNRSLLGGTSDNSSVLYIHSLLPEYEGHLTCVAVSCQDNYWGELCGQVCNCTGQDTCNRTLGCVCSGDGCSVSQTVLLAISLPAGALILLLLGAIFLLYRHNNRLRIGNIDDPEVFQLGQDLKVRPDAACSRLHVRQYRHGAAEGREIDRSRLQLKQLLGEGAFGHVVEATLAQTEEEDVVVAVKKLKDDDDPQARQDLLREICIMLLCGNHDNVLGMKGICFRDGPLQLVLEYAEHGSLLHLLWTLRAESKLNRTVLVNKRHIFENMMVEVCCGLEHLETRRLVHRDIAARNILICGKGTAKIADFGLARDMYAVGYHRQDRVGQGRSRDMYAVGYQGQDRVGPGTCTLWGTKDRTGQGRSRDMYAVGYQGQGRGHDLLPLKWMSPEGLKNEARFTHKSDVWSFGVLLWEVAQLGRTPYPGMEGADRIYDALQNHFRLPRPQLCTEQRYQLMRKCWKFNEKTRPDATTVRKLLQADPNGFFYFTAPVATVKAPVTPLQMRLPVFLTLVILVTWGQSQSLPEGMWGTPETTRRACEYTTLSLTCNVSLTLKVNSALYGRTQHGPCGGPVHSTNCRSGSSLSTVRRYCQGRRTWTNPPSSFATHQFCLPLFFSYQCQKTKVALVTRYHQSQSQTGLDLTAARPNCKSRSGPYHTPHGSRRETDRAPDGSLTETDRQGDKNRRTLGVMTPTDVYAEDMPNGRRFKCDLSIKVSAALIYVPAQKHERSPSGSRQEPARDLTAARPNCKSRSAPYHTPHGSRRETDRAPDGSLTETGRKIRRTLGVMTPAGVYAEDMPNGRRFKCDLSIITLTIFHMHRFAVPEPVRTRASTGGTRRPAVVTDPDAGASLRPGRPAPLRRAGLGASRLAARSPVVPFVLAPPLTSSTPEYRRDALGELERPKTDHVRSRWSKTRPDTSRSATGPFHRYDRTGYRPEIAVRAPHSRWHGGSVCLRSRRARYRRSSCPSASRTVAVACAATSSRPYKARQESPSTTRF